MLLHFQKTPGMQKSLLGLALKFKYFNNYYDQPKVNIKKSCPQLNSCDLENMFNDDLVYFQNSQECSTIDCLGHFRNNLLDCKTAISKAKV